VGVFLSGLTGRSAMMMKSIRIVMRGIGTRGIAMLACCWSLLLQWCAAGLSLRNSGAAQRGRPLHCSLRLLMRVPAVLQWS